MIEVIGLTKRYGRTIAVDDLSFVASPGRVTGFLGPNGAGKSTTMRMIVGLDRPNAGRALVAGRTYRELAHPTRFVGALLDATWTHPRRSARNHLRWLARAGGISTARVDEVLGLVGLAHVAGHRTGSFSLGMAQRLGIATALLGDPHVLLFDEPINGLDPEGIRWARQLIRRLAAEGRTVLVSSHLLSEMALTADDLVVIGRGRLVSETSVADLIKTAKPAVRVRSPEPQRLVEALRRPGIEVDSDSAVDGTSVVTVTGMTTEQVGQAAADAGLVLYELAPHTTSLEDAYMSLTQGLVEYRSGGGGNGADPATVKATEGSPT